MKAPSTQDWLDVKEVRLGLVETKDGAFVLIFEVSALNFDLKSDAEKEKLILAYRQFLNSLRFTVQIPIRSEIIDLSGWFQAHEARRERETHAMVREQMDGLGRHLRQELMETQPRRRRHYLVLRWAAAPLQNTALAKRGRAKPGFEEADQGLVDQRNTVIDGLKRLGLRARQLDDRALMDLLASWYSGSEQGLPRPFDEYLSLAVTGDRRRPEATEGSPCGRVPVGESVAERHSRPWDDGPDRPEAGGREGGMANGAAEALRTGGKDGRGPAIRLGV